MFLTTVTTGGEKREFNGPVLLPIWNGAAGTRAGQIAYDLDGDIDPEVGPSLIYWDGTVWKTIGTGDSSVWGSNDVFPAAPKIIPASGDIPATIVQLYDQYTRTVISYSESVNKIGGGAITDADLGPIYIKDPATNKYYVRNWEGPVYPRWWGAVGDDATDDSAAWQAAIDFSAPLEMAIDGEGKSYKIGNVEMKPQTNIFHAEFRLTAGQPGLWIGEVDQEPTAYLRTLILENIILKGSCTYALIVSTITGISIKNVVFQNVTATNDVFYLLNTYDGLVDRLAFTGCTAGDGGSCLHMEAGANGMQISRVYTSAFTDYGIRLTGGAGVLITASVIQGATTGIYMSGTRSVTLDNPYYENVVNPLVINSDVADIDSIVVRNGYWGGPYGTHPDLALNNGVMIQYIGGRNGVSVYGGRFDVSDSGFKKLASVGNAGVIHFYSPQLSAASNTPEITNYLFKEATALSTAGYHVEYTANANVFTSVRRTTDIANEHIVERFDSGANVLRATWTPPNVGSAAAALTFYQVRVSSVNTGSVSLNTGQDVVRFNTTSGALIATLPITGMTQGKWFMIKKTAGANTLTVTCSGGVVTIDGSTSVIMRDIGETLCVQWDGAAYIIVSRSGTNNPIYNQITAVQTADYAISGRGSTSRFMATRADNAAYQGYYGLGRSAIDDSLILWDVGVTGVPIAGSGPSLNSGGTFSIRSFTVAGVLINDVLTITRNGRVTVPITMQVGTGSPTFTGGALDVIGSITATGELTTAGNLRFGGTLRQYAITTVTGDYTIGAGDLYVNVNNAANCVITLPVVATGTGAGRVVYIKKISNNAATVTVVSSNGIITIDGSASYIISTYNDPVFLHDDGTNWYTYTRVVPAAVAPTLDSVTDTGNTTTNQISVGGIINSGGHFQTIEVVEDGATLTLDQSTVICNTSANDCDITLPTGGTAANIMYYIKRSSPAFALTVNTGGGDSFDDSSTALVVTNAVVIQLQGTTWWVLSSF